MSIRAAIACLAAGVFALGGCVVDVATRAEFDGCGPADTCAGASTCVPVRLNNATGHLCSYACNPEVPKSCGGDAVCIGAGGPTGQCYRLCTGTGTCPGLSGTICAQIDLGFGNGLTTAACIPGAGFGGTATPTQTLPVYAACTPGSGFMTCQAGTACEPSAVSPVPGRAPGFTCTSACDVAEQCPGGPGFANCVNGRCAPVCSNPGAFDARCAMFGTECAQTTNALNGQLVAFCAP